MSNEEELLKIKLKNKFIEWCENTTNHGMPHIIKGKNIFARMMWAIIFILCVAYCLILLIRGIKDYLKYETAVSININHELPAPFPAVTICNINPFNEKNYEPLLAKINEHNNKMIAKKCEIKKNCLNKVNIESNGSIDINLLKRYTALQMPQMNLGFDLDKDMLISCKYNSRQCSAHDFSHFWSNTYGNCYTFNHDKNQSILYTSEVGADSGLHMELLVESTSFKRTYAYKTGLHVIVHNQSSLPFTLNKAGINIPTGYETYIGVTRTFTNKLDHPYSDCLNELHSENNHYAKKLFQYIHDLNVTYYDQTFCFDVCYQDKLIDRCNCNDIITPKIRAKNYCTEPEELDCLFNFRVEVSNIDLNKLCSSACLQQCKRVEYKFDLSMAKFSSLNYLKSLKHAHASKFPINESDLESFGEKAFLKLIVNYNQLYYTSMDEMPKLNFESLIGSIGGQLGFLIGVSVISLLEFIELFSEFIIIYYKHRKKKNLDKDDKAEKDECS